MSALKLPALVLLASCAAAQATPPLPGKLVFPTVAAFARAMQGEVLQQSNPGDLDGDGVPDRAVLLTDKPGTATWEQKTTLYVLRGTPAGLELVAQTSAVPEPGAGCCWTEGLGISRGTLVVHHFAKTATTHESALHRFALREGRWRLVGRTLDYEDRERETSSVEDWNLMTGKVVKTTSDADSKVSTLRAERKAPPAYLENYDFQHSFGEPGAR